MLKKVLRFLPFLAILTLLLGSFTPAMATDVASTPSFNISYRTKSDQKYVWTIDKVGDAGNIILVPGQSQVVNYTVTVNATSSGSGSYLVNFGVKNNAVEDLVVKTVSFTIDGASAPFNCPAALPATVATGVVFNCQHPGSGPQTVSSLTSLTAVATFVTDGGGLGTDHVTTLTQVVDFSDAAHQLATPTVTDECINVSDTLAGSLGVVCASDGLPKTFSYSKTITAPDGVCEDFVVNNTASFVTNDTGATGSDIWTVNVDVQCTYCSLTPGYWKTHSTYGPAKYDATWALLGENTTFFQSGQSYYNVLWTSPQGNAYYILAHAYIAAKLNGLDGASLSSVASQMTFAESFFNSHTPTSTLTKAERALVINAAYILDQYNNGLLSNEVGHCQ